MVQDRPLQRMQLLARVEAELVAQDSPRVAIHVERVGLPAGSVERDHQVAAQALAERMRANKRFELRDEVAMVAERELEVNPPLDAREAKLLETLDLVLGKVVVREVGQRRPAPERKRLVQLRSSRPALERSRFGKELLEVARVYVLGRDFQAVAGSDRLHRLRPELFAKARDVSLQGLGRGVRRLAMP